MKGIGACFMFCFLLLTGYTHDSPRRGKVLLLGKTTESHAAGKHATWMAVELFKAGINLTYTEAMEDLNAQNLGQYDALVIFSDFASLPASRERALKDFVSGGKGLIVVNRGAAAFGNSQWYTKAVGGRPAIGSPESSRITITGSGHEIGRGVTSFDAVSESYRHQNLSADNIALLETTSGPQAWVRQEGKGRVFYLAPGAADQTWKNRSYLQMLNNGTLWAIGDKVREQIRQLNIPSVSIYPDTIADFAARHFVPKMQEPLSPEESNKLLQLPVGFELKLFASEPDIKNPLAMSWDEKGRLWIIEAVDYPNNFTETKGAKNDRIKICEDTDGDGKADKFTVFADNLNIATSLTFANGGIIVAQAPHFLFLKDTNGDDVADVRDTLMTGWNKWDTHAGPSNLQYGFDNKIWGVTGYSGFDGYINGERKAFSQGVYHFKPDGSAFEFLATTSNNTWGLGMTEDNNVFISTANNTHSAFYSMPEKLFAHRIKTTDRAQQLNPIQKIDGHYDVHALTPNLRQVDVVGGFTSAAGHQMYTARDYPETYWNKVAFVTEPTVRLVHNAIIEPDGAGFKEKDGWNLVSGSDEWFGPVHAEVGPDGAVWILDWYNFIIQHNVFVPAQAPSDKVLPFTEQPHGSGNAFESDLRDRVHGRVYRVVYKGAKHNTSAKLSKNDVSGLLKALKSDNKFWRMHAQRLLVERQNDDVTADLIKIAADRKTDKIGLNAPAIHALWTLEGLNTISSRPEVFNAVVKALSHPSAGVRKAAVQVLPVDDRSGDAILRSGILSDANLNTRLAAFVKLAGYPASEAIALALHKAAGDPVNEKDRWLSQALLGAAAQHQDAFIKIASARPAGGLVGSIRQSLTEETYTLGRRTRVQFSPDVAGKEIHIGAEVRRNDKNEPFHGLIVGQGDKNDGYALFMKNNRLFFEVYQHGNTTTIATGNAIPDNFTVDARIAADATASLVVSNVGLEEKKLMHLFAAPLKVYLRSGEDFNDIHAFTDYGESSRFTGNANNITVRLFRTDRQGAVPRTGQMGTTSPSGDVASERVELKALLDIMQYDKKQITVPAGRKITLLFENPDVMQHNLLIIRPGTLEIVGKAADEMLLSPDAGDKQYVPGIPEVLYKTPLVDPGKSFTLEFTAPTEPGDYPYVCTFPGHWRGMNGIMRVVNQ